MMTRDDSTFMRLWIVLACALFAGCALEGGPREAFFDTVSGSEAVESSITGEALTQRKSSMRRLRRDLATFRKTFEQLARHGKSNGLKRFERFARPFIEARVDPLLTDSTPTSHPELRPFRAELMLSKAVLMDQMGDVRSVRETIDRLESDFASMGSMLVLYPTGEAVTLEQGIAILRTRTGES